MLAASCLASIAATHAVAGAPVSAVPATVGGVGDKMKSIRYVGPDGFLVTQRSDGTIIPRKTVSRENRKHDHAAYVKLRRRGYSLGLISRRYDADVRRIIYAIHKLAPELLGMTPKYTVHDLTAVP